MGPDGTGQEEILRGRAAVVDGENPCLCYQCAKCSTGCPLSSEMDLLPHQIIHLLSLDMEERALKSKTIWLCASCYTCAVRCPNDIDITSVMDELRGKALSQGVPCPFPEILTFHKNFMRDLMRRGRVHELRMMGEYNLRTGHPFHDALLGLRMFLKGRLRPLPPRAAKGFKRWARRLWKS